MRFQVRNISLYSSRIYSEHLYRFHGLTLLFFILFLTFYIWQIVSFILDIHRLIDMYNFYTHLLKIPDVRTYHLLPSPSPADLLTTGRHPNNFLARSRPTHRSNPRRKPHHSTLLQNLQRFKRHYNSQTRRTRYR